ncbi:PQ-loop domain-containing transporter [Enterococcus mundtii]|uniref:PQ-loop domain-containing transporter n=1 Tax=Enterococcus mundtii TaxID=53346 RepID=UPI001A96A2C7|nr:PQ-loop domain-containing transporter [Enterococcus mundtii]MBO1087199.1 hypothetical protein [Enterococcus mundtii]
MKVLLLTIAPLISMIAITISYLPQLKLTFRTKNVKGQSFGFWFLLNIALLGLLMQQVGLIAYLGNTNYSGAITQFANWFFGTLMLIMIIIYRNKDDNDSASV